MKLHSKCNFRTLGLFSMYYCFAVIIKAGLLSKLSLTSSMWFLLFALHLVADSRVILIVNTTDSGREWLRYVFLAFVFCMNLFEKLSNFQGSRLERRNPVKLQSIVSFINIHIRTFCFWIRPGFWPSFVTVTNLFIIWLCIFPW